MKRVITILAVLFVIAMVGCARPAPEAPAAPAPAAPAPEAPAAAPTEGEAEAEAEAEAEPEVVVGELVLVNARNFEPETITTKVGGTITWKNNEEKRAHQISAKDGTFRSGRFEAGESYSYTFEEAGTYAYFDVIMKFSGTVEVIE